MPARSVLGRDDELSVIDGALAGAVGGRTAIVVLRGEGGIGKSWLAEEAAARAANRGMRVAWGLCWEVAAAPAFWPWVQVLRALDRSELAEPGGAADPDARFAMFDRVLRALDAECQQRPLLLVLDDAHAADTGSLELAAFVASHARNLALAMLVAARDVDARLSPAAAQLLDRIGRAGHILSLRRLGRDGVAALAVAARRRAVDADELDRLWQASEGNPLFVTEILRASGDDPVPERLLSLPEGVRAVITARLAAIEPSRLPVLDAAAAIGREFGPALVAAICERELVPVVADLEAAAAIGVIAPRGPGQWAFAHGMIADLLRQRIDPDRRARLHGRIADELERRDGGGATAVFEIADHLLEAGPVCAVRAVAAARRASARALGQLGFDQAVAFAERALAAADAAHPDDRRLRADLLIELAHARVLAGDAAGGQAVCREALALARALGAPELFALAALRHGAAFTIGRTDHGLVQLLEQALAGLPPEQVSLRARLLGRLAAALQPARDPDPPIALAREAIALARELDDRTRLEVHHVASAGLVKFGPPGERAEIDGEACRLAVALGEPSLELRARARLVFDYLELGDVATARRQADAYGALAATFRHPALAWPAPMFRAMLALYEGRFDDHRAHVGAAERLAAETDDPLARHCLELHRIAAARARGDNAALSGATAALWEQMRAAAPIYDRTLRWMILGRLGRTAELRDALATESPEAIIASRDPLLGAWAAEVVAHVRDRRWADVLMSGLSRLDTQLVVQSMHGMFVDGPLARPLFLLADVLDRVDEARRQFERARAIATAHSARPVQARIEWEWSTILAARGHADEAQRWLDSAAALARALAIPLAAQIGAPPVDAPPRAPTLVREGDYWTVSWHGGTVRIRHGRGIEMLARLIEEPGRELHVLELVGADAVDAGDAGPLIDGEARDVYRRRLRELDAELAEASTWNDIARAERLRHEQEALAAELSRALGLGGRTRRAGAAAERARVNVQRRISSAIKRIQERHASLGEHLARSVKTGIYCSYDPARTGR